MHYLHWFPYYQFFFLILPPHKSHSVISNLLSDNVAGMSFLKSIWFSPALKESKTALPSGPKQRLLFNPILFLLIRFSLPALLGLLRYVTDFHTFKNTIHKCNFLLSLYHHASYISWSSNTDTVSLSPGSLQTTFSPRVRDRLLTLSCHTLAHSLKQSLTFSVQFSSVQLLSHIRLFATP